ncbi:MAG: hypothetical protein Q4F95_09055 [Oscillospiraceae bacterium]|nr:hypothetical protein [Oscillospiraceae bacterium]
MTDLIKAEWFRLRHSGSMFKLLTAAFLTGVLFSFVNGILCFDRASLSAGSPTGMMFVSIAASAAIGTHYQNRTAYYEIMDGRSDHAIILSRLAVYSSYATVFYFVPVSVLLMIFDGGAESAKFLILLYFILLRLLLFCICLVLIFKNAAGFVLIFPRIIIEVLLLNMVTDPTFLTGILPVLKWLPLCQCQYIGSSQGGEITAKVIIGFIIEAAVMYTVAYTSYKKKWMIKTTLV